ncbi:hypothetical protein [Fusibacillus kribbianus]|uniref:Cohesin domain-containing protein n=1 Tax=Fusibacillus kribbianus TaxID=3044208 RepID=A0AAP4EX14_9FIRM|nr:hypothetical protein [Ruminococcus sp. YH-rum2234]MDI9241287.1 cohesin domain-containing protein [Ruminococcus sp. YH-rum2234]
MKAKKKWLSLLGAAVMAAALVVAPGAKEVKAAGAPVVTSSIQDVSASVGDEISIPITFTSESTNLSAIHGEPSGGYDTSVLEYQGAEYVGIPAGMESTAGGNFGYVTSGNFSSGTINVKFKVLKCSAAPVTVKISNIYFSNHEYLDSEATELTAKVTISHPADQYQTNQTDPTCTAPGHKTVTCGVCGATIEDKDLDALGHDDGEWVVTKEATCTEKGVKELQCTRDGAVLDTQEIPLAEHTWDEGTVTKEATCTEEGVKVFYCTGCQASKTEAIEKTPHSWDEGTVTKEATCTEEGEKLYTCTECEEIKKEVIQKTPHKWIVNDKTDKDGWEVITEATAEKEGSKERVCAVCGEKETAVIAKLTPAPETKPVDTANQTSGSTTSNTSGSSANAVNTGDTAMAAVYVVIIAAAACAAGALVVVRRRKTSH